MPGGIPGGMPGIPDPPICSAGGTAIEGKAMTRIATSWGLEPSLSDLPMPTATRTILGN